MKNLVLFGFMGTGKTLISKKLSKLLPLSAVDMDALIEDKEKTSISSIFADKGEPYFRELERVMAQELSKKSGLLISTGGGVVLNPENIQNLSKTGVCVCLTASPETIYERVRRHSHRPLLNTEDPLATIKTMLSARQSRYDAVPYHVATDAKSPELICEEIIALYNKHAG
ncbi:MAG: shikimate kinase [Candidatus Auribacter fodinae]|jgi:shikimate kinase|uniref:Shikimate kinase n=1 Tax=Candidatus Auribacter fodinae TaxID=2093366 RepID=A0A3A4REG6_9BACT|nr:MAG: shikimate kinase [Candidatus Auribacter fodinae]